MSRAPSVASIAAEARRTRLSLELLVQRRMGLLLTLDALLIFGALVGAHLQGGDPGQIYFVVVDVVYLMLGVPVLSGCIAVERNAGSLDLVLSSPAGHLVFVRRVAAVCGLMVLQAWATVALAFPTASRSFPIAPVLVQTAILAALVGSVVLFWSVRLRDAGSVAATSLLTLLLLGPWTLFSPVRSPQADPLEFIADWARVNLILALAAVLFFLYAQRRLRRPETFIR